MIVATPSDNSHGYSCILHDSIADVSEAEWMLLVDESRDLAMDRRLIAAQERTLADQCRIWTVIVRDALGQPVACAMLCLFRTDAAASAPRAVQKVIAVGRGMYPRLLRIGVLFCGLPVPAGSSHMRIAPHADADAAIACLHDAMNALAKRHRAALLVFKEWDARVDGLARSVAARGYVAGDVPPMYRLVQPFTDFDEYLDAMRCRYRSQVRRSLRKIDSGRFRVDHHSGPDAIANAYTDGLHELYLRVWERSKYQLEQLHRDFFHDAAAATGDDAALTVIRRLDCGTPVGFTFSIVRGNAWHNLYSGVDYSVNGHGDILFNLFYADLARAMERGCDDIHLGQTSDVFKSRLGAEPLPLQFFVRGRSRGVHLAIRIFRRVLFPTIASPPSNRVFTTSPSERERAGTSRRRARTSANGVARDAYSGVPAGVSSDGVVAVRHHSK